MIDHDDPHLPTPEFRASLKRELQRAYRAAVQFDTPRVARARRIGIAIGLAAGAVMTLTVGLVLGAVTGYASAKETVASANVATTRLASRRQFAATRLDVARANYDAVRQAYEAGQATRTAMDNAKTEVDSMQANLARVEVELASGVTPAPSSGGSMISKQVKTALTALTCSAAAATAQTPSPQQGIPIVTVTAPVAKTTTTLGAVLGVRELPGGRLLVNDAGRRQIKIFDATLANATVAQDSVDGLSNSYGPRPAQIVPYLGDSTLFKETLTRDLLVLDASGRAVRTIAPPMYEERGFMRDGMAPFSLPFPPVRASDNKGRLIAQAGTNVRAGGIVADSTLIVRADLDSREVDVVGAVHHSGFRNRAEPPEGNNRVVTTISQPVPSQDSWAVLSDGTVAFVRVQDYHVDWVLPDGTKSATTKLPFDWKRLTDEDKQHLADSAKVVWDSLMILRNKRNATPTTGRGGDPGAGEQPGRGARSGGGAAAPGQQGSIQRMISVPISEIPDYYPPINQNSAMPDLDGNLWILPTTSAQSQHGELVYDVVNPKGGLIRRVRMPVGRSVAGFGKGGVVYLQSGDRTNGFYLERVKLEVK